MMARMRGILCEKELPVKDNKLGNSFKGQRGVEVKINRIQSSNLAVVS